MTRRSLSASLSLRQYTELLIGSVFGSGVLIFPRFACELLGRDGWLAPLVGAVLPALSAALCMALCRRAPGKSFAELAAARLPRPVFLPLSLLLALWGIAVSAGSLRMLCEATHLYLLPRTPMWVVVSVTALLVGYAVWGGERTVARFSELTSFCLVFGVALLFAALPDVKLTSFSPALTASLPSLLESLPLSAYSYSFPVLVLLFYPRVREGTAARTRTFLCILLSAGIFSASVALCIGVFGAGAVTRFLFPVVMLYKSVPAPIIERLDLFFLLLWGIVAVRPGISFVYAAAELLEGALPPRRGRAGFCAAAASAGLWGSMLLLPDAAACIALARIIGLLNPLLLLGIPVILLLRKEKNSCG